jgi:hypothetical protein
MPLRPPEQFDVLYSLICTKPCKFFFLKEGFPPISIKEINIYKVFHLTHTSSQGTRVFETTRMAGVGGKSNKGRTLSIQSKPC